MMMQTPRDGFGGIAFLHTAPGHVATFGVLMTALAPNIPLRQTVRADLLQAARDAGTVTPAIAAEATAALEDLSANGARVVVCTCSTLGGCVPALRARPWTRFLRIDTPMAETAARIGGRILVAATVKQSLASASALLEATAAMQGRPLEIRGLIIDGAWPLFVEGDRVGYRRAVVAAVRQAAHDIDAVVLAQASMAGAADDLADLGVPVLSSPQPGVAQAIAVWRESGRDSALSQG